MDKEILVFLDFDGVLHPWFPLPDLAPEENELWSYLPRFEAVMRDFLEVNIVVTSTWRINRTLEELREPFSKDIRPRIVGATKQMDPHHAGARHREVLQYLVQHGRTRTPWIALDDVPEHYHQDAPLIRCANRFGDNEEGQLRSALLTWRSRLRSHA